MPKFVVFDLEADDLAYTCTKLHVLVYAREDGVPLYTTDPETIRSLFAEPDTIFVCHNAVTFDSVALKRLFDIDLPYWKIADSLALSWYLDPNRPKHGLASWGEQFGIPKPEIDDWQNLSFEEYVNRCVEDVRINLMLWKYQWNLLKQLYTTEDKALRLIGYLSFKMDCLREQEELGWYIDYNAAVFYRDQLDGIIEQKKVELMKVMPPVPKKTTKKKPAKMQKKDGSMSVRGAAWLQYCEAAGVCPVSTVELEVITKYEQANPGSHVQVKKWLFDLGWLPCTFDFKRDGKHERKIPQVRFEGELTESVKELIPANPSVGILDGLTVAEHRRAIFEGFINNAVQQPDGLWKVVAGAHGLTNTLRFRHRAPLVNLPGVDKPWGEQVRGVLVGNLVGCDLVSLEDTTKRHYMMPHDPAYVAEMQKPGYDPHLSLAMFAGVINQQQYDAYDGQDDLKAIRSQYKVTNYSATYGIQPKKLSRTLKIEEKAAKRLLDAFWSKNWAIEEIAKRTMVKKIGRQKWLFNPVSGFYYSLRFDKDKFSTLNQGTGVFVFDTFLAECRQLGLQSIGQFHDEFIAWNIGDETVKATLDEAARRMNETLQLNVPILYDHALGYTYSEIH